jgi:cobalamin biosynthesis protein CobT
MKSKTISPELAFLEGPFTKIAKAMSKNFNVRVVPSGFECKTNGHEIHIPFNADMLPESKRQVLNGVLDHEIGHVIEEREAVEFGRQRPLQIMEAEKNSTIRLLFNAFEDIRIELKFSLRWPGVADNIRAANEQAVSEFLAKGEAIGGFWHQIACYLITASRGLSTDWIRGRAAEKAPLLAAELEASKTTKWADDCMVLARRTYAMLKESLEEDKSEKDDSEEKGPKSDEECDGDSKSSLSHDSTDGESSEAFSGEEEKTGAEAEEGAGEEDGEEDAEELTEATVTDIFEGLKKSMAKSAARLAIDTEAYVPNPMLRKFDKIVYPNPNTPEKAKQAKEAYEKAKADVDRQIGTMRAKQLAYYQTISRRKVVGGLEEGQLEDSEITSIRFGNRAVFNDARRGRMLDTAVEVLLDLSGSMRSNTEESSPSFWAFRTAVALAEAWEALRMPYEIMGFTNVGGVIGYDYERKSGMVGRPAFEYPIFKGWDERLANCRPRFAVITGREENADGEAVMFAAQRLALRREERRILVVVSDGVPACPGIEHGMNSAYLKKVVRQITRAGFEVIGFGANTQSVKHFYNKGTGASHLVINDLNNLAKDIFSHLQSGIVGAA